MDRTVTLINTDWLYTPTNLPRAAKSACPEGAFQRVSLPHTNVELPYHNFSEAEHCFVSWYRKHFRVPREAKGRRVFIDFDGVMIAAKVFVNGKPVHPITPGNARPQDEHEHKGGFTPFCVDVTDLVKIGQNVLAVRVDSSERNDIPPFGFVVDYLTFGGIYRDVHLRVVDEVFVRQVFAQTPDAWMTRKQVRTTARIANTTPDERRVNLRMTLTDPKTRKQWGAPVVEAVLAPDSDTEVELLLAGLEDVALWDIDAPNLYTVRVSIEYPGQRRSQGDSLSTRIGFRFCGFSDDGSFYLNGRAIKLRGLNRHQTYAYVGQAGPARMQRKDADIIKHDLACNIVRTSHYPQSPHFLDRCDEIGLLVLEEIPGWQNIGDDAWKAIALRDVEAMIVRDRNRPAIVLWGVRINESADDHDFYTRTNALARTLDPTRQTGGIRFRLESEMLEDVFTMNDFYYTLREPNHARYLHTEFCGHMYPTKTYDQEERVKQHALHHAHIHNQVGGMKSAGAIGWCAFDYNTHAVFGSGDRICYHGVMDLFRQPKFAGAFYAAHADPKQRVVLEPATYWKMGDKSGGGVEPVVVFSNCDEVELIVGGQSRGRVGPAREQYPNLERPPFIIEKVGHVWGGDWQSATFVGYINGEKVAERHIANDGIPARLEVTLDDKVIDADGADMTRLGLRLTDKYGNILPFAMDPVGVSIRGPGVLVGDNPFPMPGGRGALYVRSTRKAGTITLTATAARLKPVTVTLKTRAVGD